MAKEDDEIQILGTREKNGNRAKVILCTTVILVLILISIVIFIKTGNGRNEADNLPDIAGNITHATDTSFLCSYADTINDVPLRLVKLHNMQIELSLDFPDTSDIRTAAAVPAADIRKDNLQILGDFVLKGEQLARGKSKSGYCLLMDGNIEIGIDSGDEKKEQALRNNGSFFRQYILVHNGEIQDNNLKGKAIRRSIAIKANELYIIQSFRKESIYDFSEAISDLGFTTALYLPGGDSYGFYKEHGMHVFIGNRTGDNLPNRSYLIFIMN